MNEWVDGELALLQKLWPNIEYVLDGHWVLRREYALPAGWNRSVADLAFRVPQNLPAEQPYGFWIRGGLTLASGLQPANYQFPSDSVPFGSDSWGRFSWSPEAWSPGAAPGSGHGMVLFAQSFRRRLEELN